MKKRDIWIDFESGSAVWTETSAGAEPIYRPPAGKT
jgi:hypothetical protein